MKIVAALVALALLGVGCGGGQDAESVVTVGAGGAPSQKSPPPESSALAPGAREVPSALQAGPAGIGMLMHCEDIPRLGSRFEGKLGARENPDHDVKGVLATYRMEHPDTYGGHWVDRDNGGALVMAFTDDPEAHREAILARAPAPGDRMLREREDVTIDVVRVRFNLAELKAMQLRISRALGARDLGLMGSGIDMTRNVVSLDFVDPPEGALEEAAELAPDAAAVCIDVIHTSEPPIGPLRVIPDLDVEDPLVRCPGTPAVRYSELTDPHSIDDVDHPAVDALRAEFEAPGGETLPRGRWVVISIGSDLAIFAALSSGSFGVASVERRGDKWLFAAEASGPPCEPTVALPAGLARVELGLNPDSLPSPDDTSIEVLVTEQGCASGREMGDALMGPQVIETGEAVLVAFAVRPVAGGANCPDNPSTAVTIELSEPLGERKLYDGLHVPPKALTAAPN